MIPNVTQQQIKLGWTVDLFEQKFTQNNTMNQPSIL
jgi:hypothetical protein